MRRVALVIGSEVGPAGRRRLAGWRWVRVDPGFVAVEAVESLRPGLVIVKEVERPAEVVASVRAAAGAAAIVVLARNFEASEGLRAVAAGAHCYKDAHAPGDQGEIIRAAVLARRRRSGGGGGLPPASSSSSSGSLH